jgi:hypothetical protein
MKTDTSSATPAEKPVAFTPEEKARLLTWLKQEIDAGHLQPASLGRTKAERELATLD